MKRGLPLECVRIALSLAASACAAEVAPTEGMRVPDASIDASDALHVSADAVGRARERQKVEAAPSPIDLARLRFDLAALPLASERGAAAGEVVHVARDLSEVSMVLANGLVAEIQIGSTRLYTQSGASPFAASAHASRPHRAFDQLCRDVGSAPVRWRGFRADTATDASLDYVEYLGTYDPKRCAGVAATKRTAKAIAVIPGALYAFRTCLENCEPVPALPRRESVIVIGPPSRMLLESRSERVDPTNPQLGSFSISEISVEPDAIGTLSMNLPTHALERGGVVAEGRLLGIAGVRLDVEVRGGARPQDGAMNLFVAAFQADAAARPTDGALSAEALGQRFRPRASP